MSEQLDEKERRENRFAEAISQLGHSPFGMYLGLALLFALPVTLVKWDGHLFDRKGCVEVEEKGGRYFKVDTCSGTVEELNISKKQTINNR